MAEKSIIGKFYIATDNSWCYNISTEGKINNHLASTITGLDSIISKIVTEPFDCKTVFLDKESIHTFIIVQSIDKNESYIVLYRDSNVFDSLDEAIERKNYIINIKNTTYYSY